MYHLFANFKELVLKIDKNRNSYVPLNSNEVMRRYDEADHSVLLNNEVFGKIVIDFYLIQPNKKSNESSIKRIGELLGLTYLKEYNKRIPNFQMNGKDLTFINYFTSSLARVPEKLEDFIKIEQEENNTPVIEDAIEAILNSTQKYSQDGTCSHDSLFSASRDLLLEEDSVLSSTGYCLFVSLHNVLFNKKNRSKEEDELWKKVEKYKRVKFGK